MSKKNQNTPTANVGETVNRSPIVTIMGHVDHGKTSLLDYIRKTHVTDKEAGGITQHIGAYQIEYQNHPITFIDTPGHAAFNKMRSRGAQVTDVVVLVVAATEGVKPQTVESINHIKTAGVPFIVALNKMDLPTADPMLVKSELAKYEVIVEEFGGQTPVVEVSAKTGKGVDQLLEMIQLIYELNPTAYQPTAPLKAIVIESSLSKHKGPIATVLVKEGTIQTSQNLFVEDQPFKIRSLVDSFGKPITSAGPATPVEISGFKQVPPVGATLQSSPTTPTASPVKEAPVNPSADSLSQYEEDLKALLEEKDIEKPPHLNVIIKADVQGTLEAIKANLPDEVIVIDASVGEVSDSDVQMAASTDSTIIAFHTKVPAASADFAETEKVKIKQYDIIYKLLEDIEKIILKLLEPTIDEIELGRANILQIFDIKNDRIAGCKVIAGEIKKTDLVHLVRGEKIITDVKIKSLKAAKMDVDKVKVGTECGIIISPQHSFHAGDQLVAYQVKSE